MKLIKTTALAAALLLQIGVINSAAADTIFGIYAGASAWSADAEGTLGASQQSLGQLGTDSETHTYLYLAVEHPVPLIPNVKLQVADIASQQTGTISQDFRLGSTQFNAPVSIASSLDLSFVDATLYYEILDNWLNLDLGVTLRQFDGELGASSATQRTLVDVDTRLPMVYGKAQFDLPFSGLSFAAEGNVGRFDGSNVSDLSAKVLYAFDSVIDLGVEAGYRLLNVELDDGAIQTDVEFSGPYLAAIFHF